MRMGGRPSPFGVDAVRAAALVRAVVASGADWRGLSHLCRQSGTGCPARSSKRRPRRWTLAERDSPNEAGTLQPPLVNLGGGFGVPYFAGDVALDVEADGRGAWPIGSLAAIGPPFSGRRSFAIELGRWLVAEAGVYLTRIVDRKESQRRDVPGHRWRPQSPTRRVGQFRHGGAAQLSAGAGARPGRRGRRDGVGGGAAVYAARPTGRPDRVAAGRRGRPDRDLHGGGLWRQCQSVRLSGSSARGGDRRGVRGKRHLGVPRPIAVLAGGGQ
jgi:hypothetical protein